MKRTVRGLAVVTTAAAVVAFLTVSNPVQAQTAPELDGLAIPGGPVTVKVDPAIAARTGTVTVSLRLTDPSLSEAVGEDAKHLGSKLSRTAQRNHVNALKAKQRTLASRVAALGGRERASTQKALNAVIVDVDAARVNQLAALPGVMAVDLVRDGQLDLSETVPYIGATELHNRTPGVTGAGVRVAVLDSGIDYTHARFGGAGTAEAYAAAYGTSTDDPKNTTNDGLFPTSKVIGGWDFIGETWPTGPITPDEDPIDCGPSAIVAPCAGGHGSHVASIIAGDNGVAPDAKLYMYKVCSAVSTSCDGTSMILAMDAALDPNGDGDISDAVDVLNMSIGQAYGQREDSLAAASTHTVKMGVVVVTSAGNSGDRPYITGSPGTSPEVLSVAQTQVPSALAFVLRVDTPADIAGVYKNTNTVDWAAITTGFSGDIAYGTTVADQQGCSAYPAGFFAGKIAMIDRGVCAVSIKTDNAADAGAVGVVIVNNGPGAAPSFSFGGPPTFDAAQTIIVGQEVGAPIKAAIASGSTVHAAVDPADATELVGSMVATSSRGPGVSLVAIKPEIGAPGASVSVNAGTGTGENAFGGTSGASPMVAGSAALLVQRYPARSPLEIKSVLMNTADANILVNPSTSPGVLAEITRIGSGEVRVNRAVDSKTAAWVPNSGGASLAFGYQAVTGDLTLTKTVRIRNYGATRTYHISSEFRFADDAASGAVTIEAPATVTVPSNGAANVTVRLKIDADKLPEWVLDGGVNGGNGPLLKTNEFDGYLNITSGNDRVHLPWHVLPHKAAAVTPNKLWTDSPGTVNFTNPTASGQAGAAEVFALTGVSPRSGGGVPGPGGDSANVDLRAAGVRFIDDTAQFGITTFGTRAHPNAPAEFHVFIDVNGDLAPDWDVFNADLGLAATGQYDGRNAVFVSPVGGTTRTAFFFVESDLNSANAILTVPLAAVGLAPGAQFNFTVMGRDSYFSGEFMDQIDSMTVTVGSPRYAASTNTLGVPAGGAASLGITSPAGGGTASPSQLGFLLLQSDGRVGEEAHLIRINQR